MKHFTPAIHDEKNIARIKRGKWKRGRKSRDPACICFLVTTVPISWEGGFPGMLYIITSEVLKTRKTKSRVQQFWWIQKNSMQKKSAEEKRGGKVTDPKWVFLTKN